MPKSSSQPLPKVFKTVVPEPDIEPPLVFVISVASQFEVISARLE
jgi:hypothetical protein